MDPMKTFLSVTAILVLTGLVISGCSPALIQPVPSVSEIPAATAPAIPSPVVSATAEVLPTATLEPTVAAPEPTTSAPLNLEGQAWQLVSYIDAAGVQKTPLEKTQITATFENGEVAGNASCNSYFASYRANLDKLTIGNVGATLMACLAPGVMVQEAAYLDALQKAASFRFEVGQLKISDAQGKTILVYNALSEAPQVPGPVQSSAPVSSTVSVQTPLPQASLALESLKNMDYRSGFTVSGRAPLNNGEYREAGPQGSASETVVGLVEPVAYGQLADGQVAAAVVLATNTGGSGTFYELALVVDLNGAPINIASVFLGDRIKLNSLKIENGQVLVDLIKQGPNDVMCCPTLHVLQKYALQGAELALVSSEEIK